MSRPPPKRLRTDENDGEQSDVPERDTNEDLDGEAGEEDNDVEDGEHCSICLQLFVDRAVIPECAHDFCFECILKWTGVTQSPLQHLEVHADADTLHIYSI